MKQRILTGINTTGIPHLGNYVGAIRPAIDQANQNEGENFFFLADLHGLIKCHDPKVIRQSTLAIAATWLAFGLDLDKSCFYRQSDIAEIAELNWILHCVSPKGLLNRAHAYKALVDQNRAENNADIDSGISMGLFCYPILMAADILMFNADVVPVGKDQVQHIEMARDIAGRFNHRYQEIFNLPNAFIDEKAPLLVGTDGRKMSKSYDNTIPLFAPEKVLRKHIMKIVTNSQAPDEPKNPDESVIFDLYCAFASDEEIVQMRDLYQKGIAWGEAKQILFDKINQNLAGPREKYQQLIDNPAQIEQILQNGAKKARFYSRDLLAKVKKAVGISNILA